MATGCGLRSSTPPTKPPTTTPARKTRFHRPDRRQSYLKYATSPGRHAAHRCRRLLEMPNGLLPSSSRPTATSPRSGPVTYQGQGRCSSSPNTSRASSRGILTRRGDRPELQVLKVEAEVRERRHGGQAEPVDRAVGVERERHVRVLEVGRPPVRDERVVLPVLELARERGGVAEPEHQAAVLERDGRVTVEIVAVSPGVLLEGKRRLGQGVPRDAPRRQDRVRAGPIQAGRLEIGRAHV